MKRFMSSLVLSGFLLVSMPVMNAQDHVWSDRENASWHQYLKEKHIKDHEWAKAKKKERDDYWRWRDQHRDDHRDDHR